MNDKEMRKLNRKELLELLVTYMEENEALKKELDEVKKELKDQKIKIDKAGSLAEASLQLSGIFEAADEAAKKYIQAVQERCNAIEEEKHNEE